MKIERITSENTDQVAPLFDLYRQFYEQEPDLESAKKFLYDRIENNESVIFAAVDESTNFYMGFVQLYPSFSSVSMKSIWIFNDLYVHSEYRRKGVAEALISKVKEHAELTGAKGILLETHKTNTEAQKLYDKAGFERDDDHYYFFFIAMPEENTEADL